jgi:hypothetical protein
VVDNDPGVPSDASSDLNASNAEFNASKTAARDSDVAMGSVVTCSSLLVVPLVGNGLPLESTSSR